MNTNTLPVHIKGITFNKTDLKSPIGSGLFTLYINKENKVIYKKIKNPISENEISKYKSIIYDLSNNELYSKYVLSPEQIYVENDGSYYSTFIENGILLYDITMQTSIDYDILLNILTVCNVLKQDLNEYVKSKKLYGDWALHNLIYCLDTKRIYNVDIEGFYTYPYIHDNGNCDIRYINKRFNCLFDVLNKKVHQENDNNYNDAKCQTHIRNNI